LEGERELMDRYETDQGVGGYLFSYVQRVA